MTRLEIAHQLSALVIYSLLFGYLGRVVYLISERLWITLFVKEEKRGKVKLDAVLLADAVYREMYPRRIPEYEDIDADYSALTIEESSKSAA